MSGRRGGEGQSTEELRGSDFHLHHLSTDVHTVFGFSSVHWNLILTHSLHTVSVVRMLLHIHTHTQMFILMTDTTKTNILHSYFSSIKYFKMDAVCQTIAGEFPTGLCVLSGMSPSDLSFL